MLLMIWVNDFWSLTDIPNWLKHVSASADGMGFSDVIFPVFLFIVGLSIPFAIRHRRSKGDNTATIFSHILARTFALVLMGFFMVNLENYNDEAAILPRVLWQTLMTIAFILIWNVYPRSWKENKRSMILQGFGYAILIALAIIFRSGPGNDYNWMLPHWWGILGLIGWSYLIGASAQLAFENRPIAIAACWAFLSLLNIAAAASLLDWTAPVRDNIWIISDGALPALTMAGVLVSSIYLQYFSKSNAQKFILGLVAFGITLIVVGLLLRSYWGISKIHATPAWTQICTGIGLLSFAILYWIIDMKGHSNWIRILKPAGVATLTCYLVPYLVYPLIEAAGISLPETLRTGAIGLTKSMLFALAVILITSQLNHLKVKLKI